MWVIALIYHRDVQEIYGKHPENSGNLLSPTGFFPQKFTFSD
jgi:hypothetical protein